MESNIDVQEEKSNQFMCANGRSLVECSVGTLNFLGGGIAKGEGGDSRQWCIAFGH